MNNKIDIMVLVLYAHYIAKTILNHVFLMFL